MKLRQKNGWTRLRGEGQIMGPKRRAAAAPAPAPAPAKRSRPFRTPQNPFQDAGVTEATEQTWAVERIVNVMWEKGLRKYLVKWEGWDAKDNTWEPMDNLVGCAPQIRAFEKTREAEDAKAKEEVLRKRQAAKDKMAAEAAALKEAAAQQDLADSGEGGARTAGAEAEGLQPGCLKMHKSKRGVVWSVFDLAKEKPCCALLNPTGGVCGEVPVGCGGTTNYWSHLWTYHRRQWYELKKADGKLSSAGEKELASLKDALAGIEKVVGNEPKPWGDFVSNKLPAKAKHTLDRVVSEWIVDCDHGFNAASTPGFRNMMCAATSNKYDGCCARTVKGHAMSMAEEGKQECTEFHRSMLADNIKPAASGDLWSKNGTALFGLVSHGIERSQLKKPDGSVVVEWKMVEKLAGAVPCSKDRHTGDHISDLSAKAWRETGITKPVEQLFVRVSDNGSNMLKGWNTGFQAPCVDHTIELSTNLYTHHPRIAPTLDKGRGLVGYFNSSVVGYAENTVGLNACQKSAGVPQNSLTQDVKTRWRSTHAMSNSLRINNESLLLYDVKNPSAAKGFCDNRYSLEDWLINTVSSYY